VNVWVRGRKEVVGEGNWREERGERERKMIIFVDKSFV
jgi:hypothetical protein